MENNKSLNDEIDLIDLFLVIWRKKWIIFFILFFGLTLVFLHEFFLKKSKKILVKNEILPITILDETKYKTYNSFVKSIKPSSLEEVLFNKKKFYDLSNSVENENSKLIIIKDSSSILPSDISDLEINNINKDYLLELFVDQIRQKSKLIKYIKKSKIIDVKDYENNLEYEAAVENFARSINIETDTVQKSKISDKITTRFFLEYSTFDLNKWENFLKFLDKEVNLEVQKNLNLMFERYIEYISQAIDYQIEDIETQISINDNKDELLFLKKKKMILESDMFIIRTKRIFNESPMSIKDNFYAAKILIDRDIYNYRNESIFKKIILSSIIFLVLGISFVLIFHSLKTRSENKIS